MRAASVVLAHAGDAGVHRLSKPNHIKNPFIFSFRPIIYFELNQCLLRSVNECVVVCGFESSPLKVVVRVGDRARSWRRFEGDRRLEDSSVE